MEGLARCRGCDMWRHGVSLDRSDGGAHGQGQQPRGPLLAAGLLGAGRPDVHDAGEALQGAQDDQVQPDVVRERPLLGRLPGHLDDDRAARSRLRVLARGAPLLGGLAHAVRLCGQLPVVHLLSGEGVRGLGLRSHHERAASGLDPCLVHEVPPSHHSLAGVRAPCRLRCVVLQELLGDAAADGERRAPAPRLRDGGSWKRGYCYGGLQSGRQGLALVENVMLACGRLSEERCCG
mmetsp:Transcript_116353/g.370169  ORF Transcript_116353/g.370169 Transcript_116353/m.370169 type:complete len:235 (-) Transcript_116353:175-879(-)